MYLSNAKNKFSNFAIYLGPPFQFSPNRGHIKGRPWFFASLDVSTAELVIELVITGNIPNQDLLNMPIKISNNVWIWSVFVDFTNISGNHILRSWRMSKLKPWVNYIAQSYFVFLNYCDASQAHFDKLQTLREYLSF